MCFVDGVSEMIDTDVFIFEASHGDFAKEGASCKLYCVMDKSTTITKLYVIFVCMCKLYNLLRNL